MYNREIERLHDPVSQVVLVTTRVFARDYGSREGSGRFQIMVEPLVGRITNVRNYGDHYAIILSGGGRDSGGRSTACVSALSCWTRCH